MQSIRWLEAEGWQLAVLPVDGAGRLQMEAAAQAMRRDTALVSVMLANNETGTMQPVPEIAALAHAHGALMHVDAAQGAGKIPVDVHALGADLLTLAGHKFYAPKGVGALYVREETPILPIMAGAGRGACAPGPRTCRTSWPWAPRPGWRGRGWRRKRRGCAYCGMSSMNG